MHQDEEEDGVQPSDVASVESDDSFSGYGLELDYLEDAFEDDV